jgi:hypothetical protein
VAPRARSVHPQRAVRRLPALACAFGLALSAAGVAAGGLPAQAGTAARQFSTPVHVDATAANQTGEPSISVAPDGTEYIVAPGGAPGARAPLAAGGAGFGGGLIWRSDDRGRTWTWLGAFDLAGEGGDTDIAVTPSGTLFASSLSYNGCSGVGVSSDRGETWSDDPLAGCARVPAMNDRQWTATYGENTVYTVIGDTLRHDIDMVRSTMTDPLVVPSSTLELYAGGDYQWPGTIAVDQRRGTSYVVWNTAGAPNNCDQSTGADPCVPRDASGQTPDQIYVSVVPDGATSAPAPRLVASRTFDTFDSFVTDAVDAAGNVYVTWTERHPAQQETWTMLSVSRDGGRTWSAPAKVNRAPSTTAFPWVSAGDAGRIAVSYYGTTAHGNSPQMVAGSALWSVYSSFSTDYGRTFSEYPATPAMQKGPICTSGTQCPTGSRNLLDFFETDLDPRGCLVTAYADNSGKTSGAVVSYLRQTSGPGLRSTPCR